MFYRFCWLLSLMACPVIVGYKIGIVCLGTGATVVLSVIVGVLSGLVFGSFCILVECLVSFVVKGQFKLFGKPTC